ncbi:uncharacterized protein LOC110931174 [Helianthus annuus]|uniref:uncharacterized protein LOC110931174 n=1 Tax=Helianthus annuus TaxID=4232 RepID=UPI000B909DF6|nr:uncharacterized protein LOC110931174 [Helianthus annuus]
MNFISVNLNGVSDPQKGLWIRNLKRKVRAEFIGIQESHQSGLSELVLRRFWDSSPMCIDTVDSVGRSGGLVSIWNLDIFLADQVIKNPKFLSVSGQLLGVNVKFNVINLHAPNDPNCRRSLWSDLTSLINQFDGAWILLGDFNEVRSEDERVNSRFDRGSSEAFNGFISSVGLMEYSMCGGKFTFISGHKDVKLSKLDRFLVNDQFLSSWPNTLAEVHKRGFSDHCPISLSCLTSDFGPIPFKFFNSWIGGKKLSDIVVNAINSVSEMVGLGGVGVYKDVILLNTLKTIKANIKSWRKQVSSDRLRDINLLEE